MTSARITYWSLTVMCGQDPYITPQGQTSVIYTFIFIPRDSHNLLLLSVCCVCACVFVPSLSCRPVRLKVSPCVCVKWREGIAYIHAGQMHCKWISREQRGKGESKFKRPSLHIFSRGFKRKGIAARVCVRLGEGTQCCTSSVFH